MAQSKVAAQAFKDNYVAGLIEAGATAPMPTMPEQDFGEIASVMVDFEQGTITEKNDGIPRLYRSYHRDAGADYITGGEFANPDPRMTRGGEKTSPLTFDEYAGYGRYKGGTDITNREISDVKRGYESYHQIPKNVLPQTLNAAFGAQNKFDEFRGGMFMTDKHPGAGYNHADAKRDSGKLTIDSGYKRDLERVLYNYKPAQ